MVYEETFKLFYKELRSSHIHNRIQIFRIFEKMALKLYHKFLRTEGPERSVGNLLWIYRGNFLIS